MKTDAIMELVAGYETYADSAELQLDATAEAPATSPFCASAGISWLASAFSARTVNGGC
ncbi:MULTISPECIES: LxmA leader domain family RiPP [Streptomyces]|uniref:LxmA leader domain family RiPP n=1 Tax=Streptomyces TaxID=1883 RepID=UPI0034C65D27